MERRAFLRSVGPATLVGIAGCLGQSSADGDYDVGMSAKAFRPTRIEVEPGTTVTWRNTSKQGHTVTAYGEQLPDGAAFFASGDFDSESAARDAWNNSNDGTMFQGDVFSHTFETVGEHPYFCIPHERGGMVGVVVVTRDATTAENGD